MLHDGRWPRTESEAHEKGWSDSRVSKDLVRAIVPWESNLYFQPPPFQTVAQYQQHERGDKRWRNCPFWTGSFSAPSELEPQKALVIGDFGHGSDSPIVLDYRSGVTSPLVLALQIKWIGTTPPMFDNHWIQISPSFHNLVQRLGLCD